jgi:2-phosphosulfolactate phosphatase
MQIDLLFTPGQTDDMALRDRTVVVIDVLRASTTIATALQNGAREIIPVTSVEAAVKISGNLFGEVILLGGERNGRMIEGFHLGNSPAEYTPDRVRGKSIIFSSTNGSRALVKARYARDVLVCGFINLSAVARLLAEFRRDCLVLCAGQDGMFAMEDAVCGGLLITQLTGALEHPPALSDAAQAAVHLAKSAGRNVPRMLRSSDHGNALAQMGFADDLTLCGTLDAVPVVPQLTGSVIRVRRDVDHREPAPRTVPS